MTSAAVFDLDGTLVDTPRGIVAAFTAAFQSMGVPAPEPAAIRATIGRPLDTAFSTLLGVAPDDERVALGVRRYQEMFREIVLPGAASLVFPGVADGLATLAGQGFRLAVATSKFRANAEALLVAAGLRDHFAVVAGADQVTRPKPDPEMGWLVLGALGVPAERVVMVGDTTHDLLMAAAAGMRSVAVTYGVHGLAELRTANPTWIADTFDDVLRCLRPDAPAPDQPVTAAPAPSH
jgi:phosphoglycolate phosphatase